MRLAQQLMRLARIIPGVTGHQDMEALRDTDRMIRLRLSSDLRACERDIEAVKRHRMEKKDLSLLPALDYLTAKIDKLSNVMKYAGQGYRGLFDSYLVDKERLEQLYAFDLRLFDEVQAIQERVRALEAVAGDPLAMKESIQVLDKDLDQLEKVFSTRCDVLTIH